MNELKTLVAVEDGVDANAVEAALPTGNGIQIVGVVAGLEESWEVIQETPCDLLVIACDGNSDRALFLIDGAVKQSPERPVVVLYSGSPNGFVRRVFEAGADDIVGIPQDPESIRFTIEKAMARRIGGGSAIGVATAPMICVLGPKGGTGKTLTTCNLGVALASAGHRVAVVDLDLQFGDVALALGISPDRTVYDLVKAGGTLDAEKLDGYMMTHSSGLRVLAAPTRPDHAATVTVPFLRDVYAVLRSSFDYLLVDTPPGFTPEVIASIDSSSGVCMVGMLDSLSLKNTKLGLETLELMGYPPDRVRIILNRADSRVGITPDDVTAILGREPDAMVPSDRDVARTVNDGVPLVISKPRSEAAAAFRGLAESYTHTTNGAPKKRVRRLALRKKAA